MPDSRHERGTLADLPAADAERAVRRQPPRTISPMKAVLTDRRFSDPSWVYERKLDGIRCVALRDGGEVTLASRTGRSLSASYPELVDALEQEQEKQFVVDGEIVAFEGDMTSFSRLQQRMQIQDADRARESGVAIELYLFDLLHVAGYDVTAVPLRSRKALLAGTLAFRGPVRLTTHRDRDGETYYDEACRRGWEGLIAKRADSPYVERRSPDWLKFKCSNQQELVVGGYTPPHGSRTHFGALLLGYHEDGQLVYAGKVGTGFDRETLNRLAAALERRQAERSPFTAGGKGLPRDARWVKPELVVEVGFSEWTRDSRLRHPRYLGLREDKPAREVVRERPSR